MARNLWDVDVLHSSVIYKYDWNILQITVFISEF